ncbi:MAG: uncharacterized protein JWO86_3464 [Myxococcaceae bacterium]|nr:uncharacterized protein [Myxococcaceae bacterium]MEA2750817.1 hypothetical protein [Myxococcales bacterium]
MVHPDRVRITLTTDSVWLGLCDESCAINGPQFWSQEQRRGDVRGAMRALVSSAELVDWQTVLGGTFSIEFRIGESCSADDESSKGDVRLAGILLLPTGRLVLTTGTPNESSHFVRALVPGAYDIRLDWFVDQEARHYDVPTPADYPAEEGPDGVVILRPRAPSRVS